ncbi:MAG: hypothetical protein K8T90_17160 [Planctomycetes bacterium]|nr:hypothetical protein [Planctomycetota bacterium]
MSEEDLGPGFIENAGLSGLLAIAIGLVVLALGLRVAMKRGPRRHALALLAASWLPLALVLLGRSMGEYGALAEIRALGPALTLRDLAYAMQVTAAGSACSALALTLGLSGAIAALARSSETP